MGMDRQELDLLRDSARGFLVERWPSEAAPQRLLDAQALAEAWRAAAGQGWIGVETDADTVQVAAVLQQEAGRSTCPLPIGDAFVALRWCDSGRRAAIAEGRCWPLVLQLGQDTDSGLSWDAPDAASWSASAVEGLAATDVLLLDEHTGQGWWVALEQPAVQRTVKVVLGQPMLVRLQAQGARVQQASSPRPVADCLAQLRLLLVARALGAAERMRELVVDYAKLREQFGQPIGKFQAIQHKLADVLIVTESSRALVEEAVRAFDEGSDDAAAWADAARAYAVARLHQAVLESQHAFGAIGYMEEHEGPWHFRRTQIDLQRLGGSTRTRKLLAQRVFERVAAGRPGLPEFVLPLNVQRLQQEVQDWLQHHWDAPARAAHRAQAGEHAQVSAAFSRALGEQRWLAPTLPKATGGAGCGALEDFVIKQALFAADAPVWYHGGAELVVHGIAHFGSPTQRERFLPAILEGRACFALGYSEPGSGSDLASLSTRAEREGQGWRINGQKLWTSTIEFADFLWTAVRTEPTVARHKGISIFIVPHSAPGIRYQRLQAMNGHVVGAVFFDDVYVDDEALIGAPGQGWAIINAALATERISMGANVARVAAIFDALVALLANGPASTDTATRDRVAALAAEVQAARALAMRAARLADTGGQLLADAAITKVASGEICQRLAQAAIELLGPAALLSAGQEGALAEGAFESLLRQSVMFIVGGGSAEIQRNIIAQQVLGLPR